MFSVCSMSFVFTFCILNYSFVAHGFTLRTFLTANYTMSGVEDAPDDGGGGGGFGGGGGTGKGDPNGDGGDMRSINGPTQNGGDRSANGKWLKVCWTRIRLKDKSMYKNEVH
jgi:hypothetical protein